MVTTYFVQHVLMPRLCCYDNLGICFREEIRKCNKELKEREAFHTKLTAKVEVFNKYLCLFYVQVLLVISLTLALTSKRRTC